MKQAWEDLANAVVAQAAEDWKRAKRILRNDPKDEGAKRMLRDTERFFRSEWYRNLTNINPEYLMRKLKEEIGE